MEYKINGCYPDFFLFIICSNTKNGLKQICDFESLKEEMVMKNINVTDLSEITEFIDKKFSLIGESK